MRNTSDTLNWRKWITALLVSPGLLFLFAYLSVFFSINIYLNRAVKSDLGSRSFSSGTETYQATLRSIDVDFWLTSVTIRDLRLRIAPVKAQNDVSSSSHSREQFFSSVKISGNWIGRVFSLHTSTIEKIVVKFSSAKQDNYLNGPFITASVATEAGLTSSSTEDLLLNGSITQNRFTNTQGPSHAHERLNSLFVEVLTLLSRQKL